MAIFVYGEYKINIDEENTKKFFAETEMDDSQANRNFQKYVNELMSEEEREFFDSLHIDLSKVDICYGLLSRNKKWTCNIQTYIIGRFLSYPETAFASIEDVAENVFEVLDDTQTNDITIGNFQIHIFTPEEYEHGSEDYENSIYIEFDVKDIPWLLNEKCEEKEPSKIVEFLEYHFSSAVHFIPNLIREMKDRKTERKKLITELEILKEKCCFCYEILSNKKAKGYKKLWVNSILPQNVDEETRNKVYSVCLPRKRFAAYLWYIFSFDILKSCNNATEEFNKIDKNDCTLVLVSCNNTCVKLKNAKDLTEQDIIDLCNNVAGWCDFVITADDFSWTYSRTHEDGWCGPYFYRKDDND